MMSPILPPLPLRLGWLLVASLALAACGERRGAPQAAITNLDRYAGLAPASAGTASAAIASVPVTFAAAPVSDRPVAALPAWLGLARVVARSEDHAAWEQRIGLTPRPGTMDGPDEVVVTAIRPDHQAPGIVPSEAGIKAELGTRFPDIEMRVVSRPARNTYGPYGLAVGRRADGAGCLYAWQWIQSTTAARLGAGAISLRIALCRTRENLDALASAVDHLRLDLAPAVRRRGPAQARSRQAERPAPRMLAARPPAAPGGRRYLAAPSPDPVADRNAPIDLRAAGTSLLAEPAGVSPARPVVAIDLPPEALRGPTRGTQPGRVATAVPLPVSR